jgi:hypothetical protein
MVLSTALLSITSGSAAVLGERYNFAAHAKFKKFKTYQWVEVKGAQKVDEQTDKEIKGALEAQLSQRRMAKANGDTADLYICYQAGVGAQKHFAFYRSDWRYGPGWFLEGWWVGFFEKKEGETSTIHAGELAFDMYDSKNHYLVWRGVVGKTLDTGAPDMKEKNLEKSVAKLLKKYPPPPLDSWASSGI